MPEPPRQAADLVLRWLFQVLPGTTLRPFGIRTPRLSRAAQTVVWSSETQAANLDQAMEAIDGGIWHLEFQFGRDAAFPARATGYHVALSRHFRGRRVHTVVFWGWARPLRPGRTTGGGRLLRVNQASLRPHQVFLGSLDGDRRLEALQARRGPLGNEQVLELALLPRMRLRQPIWQVLLAARDLIVAADPDLRRPVLGAMVALAWRRLTAEERARIGEVLTGVVIAQEFFDDMERRGMQKGALQTARADVLDAFEARFDVIPAEVAAVVAGATDARALRAWHRAVIRARDLREAQGVFDLAARG